ncbi:hypothetical protein [Spirosoma spitsbergense]|uniref:hypothetical protein n=1 Tax=Spirosoma spitsbergense TaxID=431554 RepID=UPI00035CAF46|nr:hypothetical protein [Spirosoma spitsbergense]
MVQRISLFFCILVSSRLLAQPCSVVEVGPKTDNAFPVGRGQVILRLITSIIVY